MTSHRLTAAGLTLCAAVASPALGQDFLGAEIEIGHGFYSEDSDISKTTVRGSVEQVSTDIFTLQGDALYSYYNTNDIDAWNLTLHGLYNPDDNHTLGAFLGRDDVEGASGIVAGFEGLHRFSDLQVEWYLGEIEYSDAEALIYGADARFSIGDHWVLGAHFDRADVGDADTDLRTVSVSAEYALNDRSAVFAEYGNANIQVGTDEASEPYVAFGLRFRFGPERGTTMGFRSLDNVVPGL